MPNLTTNLSDECLRQIKELAELGGYPKQRHAKDVIERSVAMVYQFYFLREKLERAWKDENW